MGITHLLIDVPAGPEGKVQNQDDVALIRKKFIDIGRMFEMQIVVSDRYPWELMGMG